MIIIESNKELQLSIETVASLVAINKQILLNLPNIGKIFFLYVREISRDFIHVGVIIHSVFRVLIDPSAGGRRRFRQRHSPHREYYRSVIDIWYRGMRAYSRASSPGYGPTVARESYGGTVIATTT